MRGGIRGEYEWSSSGVPPRIGSSLFRARLRKRRGFHMLRYMNAVIRCLTRSSG